MSLRCREHTVGREDCEAGKVRGEASSELYLVKIKGIQGNSKEGEFKGNSWGKFNLLGDILGEEGA